MPHYGANINMNKQLGFASIKQIGNQCNPMYRGGNSFIFNNEGLDYLKGIQWLVFWTSQGNYKTK